MGYTDGARVLAWLAKGRGDKLTTLDRGILITIAEDGHSDTGLFWKGIKYLAAVWNVTPRTVKRSIQTLGELGYLETVEHGTGQRRARYRLAVEILNTEVGGHHGPPTDKEGGHTRPSRGTPVTKKGDASVPRISESSRSYSGEMMMIEGAEPRAPSESPGLAPTGAVIDKAHARWSYTEEQAREWFRELVEKYQPTDPNAYALSVLDRPKPKTAEDRATARAGRTKKAPAKKAAAKAGTAKGKTTGKRKRKTARNPCKAEDCGINLVTREAQYTGYCAKHQQENRQYCKTEGHGRYPLTVLRQMESGYCHKCLAADLRQPPVWSETIQTDTLGFIVERRPTLDGWANLLLRVDLPAADFTTGTAAAKAGNQLFQTIAKGLYWSDRPRPWNNAIDVDLSADWFDFRVNDLRRILANGHVQMLARYLAGIVTREGTAA